MEWRDQGILLAVRPHGESAAIIEVFTPDHGRHAGVVRGGTGRRMAPVLQPGAQLDLAWRARLEDHLGAYQVELIKSRAAEALSDPLALSGLSAVCALLSFTLPEREAHGALYARTEALLDALGATRWAQAYLRWELALLDEMGFGLDLGQCAVTGRTDGLKYISPKTGKAVTAEGAGTYAHRLLPLAASLETPDASDLADGFLVTGHFLAHHLSPSLGERPLPAARQRFVDRALR